MFKIYISSGHSKKDSGAIVNGIKESDINMAIRNEVQKLLPNVIYLNDDMSLRESIDFVKKDIGKNDVVLDIHTNFNPNSNQRGVEAYYWTDPTTAECFSRNVAESVGLTNRGYFPDTQTAVGSLGWIRQLPARSVVLECGYLSNPYDRQILISANGQRNIARGIYNACIELGYPKNVEPAITNWKNVFDILKKVMSLDDIIIWVKKYFGVKYV